MNSSVEELMNNYQSVFQQWLTLSQSLIPPGPAGARPPESAETTDFAGISQAMLQALTAAASSSLSYSYSIQSILYKHQASLLALNEASTDARHRRALLIDDLRGFLREIGDTASREARSFQHQLALITEQLAQAEARHQEESKASPPS